MKKTNWIIRSVASSMLLASTVSLQAAQYDAAEYEALVAEAQKSGFARVLVTLEHYSLAAIGNNPDGVRAETEFGAQAILAELGPNALVGGYSNNGIGQMAVSVNEEGLRILAASQSAVAFARDVTHGLRIKAVDMDGSIDALEAEFAATNNVEVEIFLNVDAIDYDLDSSGATAFRPTARFSEQVEQRLRNVLSQPYANGIQVLGVGSDRPVVTAVIDRNAFNGLIESDEVRAVRPTGFEDGRPTEFPRDVLEIAGNDGVVRVSIDLRGGEFFSPKTGYMSAAGMEAQTKANERAFNDIFARAGIAPPVQENSAGYLLGNLLTTLSLDEAKRLYREADERILSIKANSVGSLFPTTVPAQIITTFTSAAPTEYCVRETSVRGDYDNLIIDHNLIVAPEDHFKTGDIYVGARFKSRPGELWLLSGIEWRKINSDADLHLANHDTYEQLPLVVPVQVFYEPLDVRAAVGDAEIWVGYGLRSQAELTEVSYAEMVANKRYSLLWEAPEEGAPPASGVRNSDSVTTLCFSTSAVAKISGPFGFVPGPTDVVDVRESQLEEAE